MAVIHPDVARWRYAEASKTEEFVSVLAAVRAELCLPRPGAGGRGRAEAETAGPKYAAGVMDQLEALLTFRQEGLSQTLFQLCHFIKAAHVLRRGAEDWRDLTVARPGPATRAGFRDELRERIEASGGTAAAAVPVSLDDDNLRVRYPDDGKDYTINCGRMPLLAALLDVLLVTDVAGELLDLFDRLVRAPHRWRDVQDCQNAAAKLLNRYLDGVLRSKHALTKFNRVVGFLEAASADGLIHFTDDNLFAFWREAARRPDEFEDFKTYRRVHITFVEIMLDLEESEALVAVQQAVPLGQDRGISEVDPYDAADASFGWGEDDEAALVEAPVALAVPEPAYRSPLLAIEERAGGIKFLTDTEKRALHLLVTCGPAAAALVRSLLRSEVFGRVQNEITEATRQQRGRRDPARWRDLVSCRALDGSVVTAGKFDQPPRSYADQVGRYRRLRDHVERLLRACGYVAVHWGKLGAAEDGDGAGLEAAAAGQLKEARRLFAAISREGFGERALTDPATGEAFAEAIEPLAALARLIDGVLEAVRRREEREGGLDVLLGRDRALFSDVFNQLYGDRA